MMKTPAPGAALTDAIPDDLVLAAVERAERHRERRGAPMYLIRAHLAAPNRSGRARRVNALVLTLAETGLLEQFRANSIDFWTLTDNARRRLRRAKGIAEAMPESPQHERWRRAHFLAKRELERYREALRGVIAETTALLNAPEDCVPSGMWLMQAPRLDRHMRRVGAATHCLYEWREPSDDTADLMGHRERGRRNPASWRSVDEEDAREAEGTTDAEWRRLSPEEFEEHFGHLPTDGEG
jgi:hypothetical protein